MGQEVKYTESDLKCHIEGIQTIKGGEFHSVKVSGVVTINGDVITNKMRLEGVSTVKGVVKAASLHVNGVTNISNEIISNEVKVEAVMNLSGNLKAKKLDIQGVIRSRGDKVEAESITCKGMLDFGGEISADFVKAEGIIRADEICGDEIWIESVSIEPYQWIKKGIRSLIGLDDGGKENFSQVDLIEGTTITLKNVRAKEVNGHNITIGDNCTIDRVDCNGTLCVSRSATIKEITGEHTFVEKES